MRGLGNIITDNALSLLILQTANVFRPLTKLYRKKQTKGLPVKCWKSHGYPLHLTTQSQSAGEPETHFLLLSWPHDPRIYSSVKGSTMSVTKISFHQMHIFSLRLHDQTSVCPDARAAAFQNLCRLCDWKHFHGKSHPWFASVCVCVCVCLRGGLLFNNFGP
jgi:hypothetical protein